LGSDLHPSLPFYRYNPRWSLALVLPVTKYTTITEYEFTGEFAAFVLFRRRSWPKALLTEIQL
jgi:hypothetical protein